MALEITYVEYTFTTGQWGGDVLLTATGGYEPYSWEQISGTLPGTLALNGGTGHIAGSLEGVSAQSTTVEFRVTDGNPGGAETATAVLPFVVVEAPEVMYESFFQVPVGVSTQFVHPITGGVAPYSIAVQSTNGPLPLVDDTAVVGTDVVFSYTLDVDQACLIIYRLTDANGVFYDTWTNIAGIDYSVGSGGRGIPHIFYRDGNSEGAQLEDPTANNITGIDGVYGGIPPYTITNIGVLPPGDNVQLTIHNDSDPAVLSTGAIEGTYSTQGVYPINFRITDSASTVPTGGTASAFYVWSDDGGTTIKFSATPDLRNVSMQEITTGIPSGLGFSFEHTAAAGNYVFGLIDSYASGNTLHVFSMDPAAYVDVVTLPTDHVYSGYSSLSFSDDGTVLAIPTTDALGENFWIEFYSHASGVLTHLASTTVTSQVFYTTPNRVGFDSTNTAHVPLENGTVVVIPSPYTAVASTLDITGGTDPCRWTRVAESGTRLLVGISLSGAGVVAIVELDNSNTMSTLVIPEYTQYYPPAVDSAWMSHDKTSLFFLDSSTAGLTLVRVDAPFTSSSTFVQIDTTGYIASGTGSSLPDNSGFVFMDNTGTNVIMNAPYNSGGQAGTFENVLNSPNQGFIATSIGPTVTSGDPLTDNYADFEVILELYKKVHISHITLNVGTINEPYRYQIKDNYAEGDNEFPTTYFIDLNGQGLLPTGYTITHDEVTGENFIEGITEFSNPFPITLAANNERYNGGAPRDTWNTTLFVGGVVSLTHEVL